MIGSIIAGVAALGATTASLISKKRQERRQMKYDAELREYNSPLNQMKRFKEAGVNPFGQEYQNTSDPGYDASQFGIENEAGQYANSSMQIAHSILAERSAQDQHDLAEQQKQIGEETLFSAKTLNSWLNDQEKARTEGLQEDAKGKKIDNAYRAAEHEQNMRFAAEDIRNKQTYNRYYGQLLQKELNLQDQQVKQFEQQYEINKNLVLVNQERYAQMIANPKQLYRMVNNQLKYDEKGNFYLLESHRIQHMLDTLSEQLLPETEKAMRAQLAYTMTHANFEVGNEQFADKDWIRWMNFGFDKAQQLGDAVGAFSKLGVYRNLANQKRWGNQDYDRTFYDGNGVMRGGFTQTYQNVGVR